MGSPGEPKAIQRDSWDPKIAKATPKAGQRRPKAGQRERKGTPMGAKASEREAQIGPKDTNGTPRIPREAKATSYIDKLGIYRP